MSALRFITGAAFAENAHNLKPIQQLERVEGKAMQWESLGEDPAFKVSMRYGLHSGWYMVTQKVESSSSTVSQLYFDFGEGIDEKTSIIQKLQSRRVYKRLVYFENPPKFVRFDPVRKPCKFTVEQLHFAPVTKQFAISRLIKRVINSRQIPSVKTEIQLRQIVQMKANQSGKKFIDVLLDYYQRTHHFREVHDEVSYSTWIDKYEKTAEYQEANIKKAIKGFERTPLISIVMPVFNTPEEFLRSAIESVISQSYPYWELCIADDASTESSTRDLLEDYARIDKRIKIHLSIANENISIASNHAVELATGEFIALLDHDDELTRHALYFMTEAVNNNPDGKMFYSDEDKLDHSGQRTHPHFKPDWNQDLFYSHNYICHFTMIDRELINRLGKFRVGVEGSQDYDLFLRTVKALEFKNIIHVSKVLYHWRMHDGSTAKNSSDKSYAHDSGIDALEYHFESDSDTTVRIDKGSLANTYKVVYPLPEEEPLVSLIIPTRDMLEHLKPCVESILERTSYKNYEILIVDNQSSASETLAWFDEIKENNKISIISFDDEFNYSAINNYAATKAKGSLIALVNNDIEVINEEWLTEMVRHALRSDIGCVGAKLYYSDDTVQHAGVVLGLGGNPSETGVAGHLFKGYERTEFGYFSRAVLTQNYSAVTAACLVVRKTVFDEVGGLDAENLKVAFNDVDFCLKVRGTGLRNIWTPYAELYHYESKSRGYEDTPKKQKRFQAEVASMKLRWGGELQNDPAYNVNLTLESEGCGLKS